MIRHTPAVRETSQRLARAIGRFLVLAGCYSMALMIAACLRIYLHFTLEMSILLVILWLATAAVIK